MSEIPAPLADAVRSHQVTERPARPRRLALHRRDGEVAFRVDGLWWSLPPAGGDERPEVCRHVDPPGLVERTDTTVILGDGAPRGDYRWVAPAAVMEAWSRGEIFLDAAARDALRADRIGGLEVAYGLRCLPLRTPTLPPATHTNCWFVGHQRALIVDPGAVDPDERLRLTRTIDRFIGRFGPPAAIFLTHHHVDHVGGAVALREATGLPIWAHPITADRLDFPIDRLLEDGDSHEGWSLLHTPGHAPGHLCLFHPELRWLVAGDMVASLGSIVVEPHDGDMSAYVAQLRRLRALEPRALAPAHGDLVEDACGRLDAYVSHRIWREQRILEAMAVTPEPLSEITRKAYRDVTTGILWLAERSTEAHLIKLEREARVARSDSGWALTS